ncbi:MAG: hypothetical protein KKH85_07270 [Proteobacteria bacterium]|nr:hypothetical protein [Pseudomonadota bacterium]
MLDKHEIGLLAGLEYMGYITPMILCVSTLFRTKPQLLHNSPPARAALLAAD